MSNLIFRAKTTSAFTIKTLSEVLQNILTDVCFEFTNDGIFLRTVDNKEPPELMINLHLDRKQFFPYNCERSFNVGVTLQHLYKLLKSVKKKDSIELFIDENNTENLGICTVTETGQKSYSYIKIQRVQKLSSPVPSGYDNYHLIKTSGFQKLCKDISSISSKVKVYGKGEYLSFASKFDKVYTRVVPFGELDMNSQEEEYEDYFHTKSLTQLIKIAGLHTNMHIYTKQDLPLCISVPVGDLGTIEVYLKSITQLEDDDDDEE